MNIKYALETITKEKAPGPIPSFQVFHVIKALEQISHSPIGRGMLAKKLEIGEGATRTLLERLKAAGLVSVSKAGCFLTKQGEEVWKEIENVFAAKTRLEPTKLTLSSCNVAILVKKKKNKVKLGMEQRDAAFLAGAKGATTLVMEKGKLTMPKATSDIAKDFPSIHATIMKTLKPSNGDAVVIGSAETWEKAEYGALAAAWTLLDNED
ncbi:MAG: DUF4443 domain-containing protein [Candidatus Bathyarchaeia archaeon]|jgi:predicted transcriptional regulator|nr:DUF4443 domain-containing protein [Candidatus Bathyarchaeota archaeon A05DMB-4]MDH7594843.1 DUF4443 domain-containing protein [Candidatus Bathyarchaeota archaeon]